MPNLPHCTPNIYKNGTLVMMTHTIGSQEMEAWVKSVSALSEQAVDWHFAGGRACVLAIGDIPRVLAAIKALMPEHDKLQRAAAEEYRHPLMAPFQPSCTIYELTEWNPIYELARESVIAKTTEATDARP